MWIYLTHSDTKQRFEVLHGFTWFYHVLPHLLFFGSDVGQMSNAKKIRSVSPRASMAEASHSNSRDSCDCSKVMADLDLGHRTIIIPYQLRSSKIGWAAHRRRRESRSGERVDGYMPPTGPKSPRLTPRQSTPWSAKCLGILKWRDPAWSAPPVSYTNNAKLVLLNHPLLNNPLPPKKIWQ